MRSLVWNSVDVRVLSMDEFVWLLVKSMFIDKNLFVVLSQKSILALFPVDIWLVGGNQYQLEFLLLWCQLLSWLGFSFCSDCKWGQDTQIHPSVLSGKWQEPNSLRLSSRSFHEWGVRHSGSCKCWTVLMDVMHENTREVCIWMCVYVWMCVWCFMFVCVLKTFLFVWNVLIFNKMRWLTLFKSIRK